MVLSASNVSHIFRYNTVCFIIYFILCMQIMDLKTSKTISMYMTYPDNIPKLKMLVFTWMTHNNISLSSFQRNNIQQLYLIDDIYIWITDTNQDLCGLNLGCWHNMMTSPNENKFRIICVWINGWVNNREAGYLNRHRAHYDVTLMIQCQSKPVSFVDTIICQNVLFMWHSGILSCMSFLRWLI